MKLLIADDNARIRWLLRLFCANVATETRDCADGDEAIEAFAAFLPDWTIMDLALPRIDGLSAIKQILTNHPGARIVVVTQYLGPEYEQAAREAGACAFVSKDTSLNYSKCFPRLSSRDRNQTPGNRSFCVERALIHNQDLQRNGTYLRATQVCKRHLSRLPRRGY